MSARDSRHSGVSCDACGKSNFTGKRYKCLTCYDFDLCSDCYDNGREGGNGQHEITHPMQCLLTRVEADLHYAGDSLSNEQTQSLAYTCPLCGKLGFSEGQLFEHVTKSHTESGLHPECICPVCAACPTGEPNLVTDDLPSHFALEHRTTSNDVNWGDRHVRRLLHQARGLARRSGGGRQQGSLFGSSMYHDTDFTFPPDMRYQSTQVASTRPRGNSRPAADDYEVFADLFPHLGRESREGIPSLPPRTQIRDLDELLARHDRSSPSHRALIKHMVRSGGASQSSLAHFLHAPDRDLDIPTVTEKSQVRVRNTEQTKKSEETDSGFLLSKLSITDTLSDEDQEVEGENSSKEGMKSTYIQELILSTLYMSDESSESETS